MITFLLYTLLAWLANACIIKILHTSIQPGQWLDTLLHWQQRLQQWDMEGKAFFVKAGGYCELCFSHLLTAAGFWIYLLFMNGVAGIWISDGLQYLLPAVLVNILWYLVYVSVGTNLAWYFIVKLFQK